MKRNRSSDTAESAAATRALESLRPSAERVIHDPWAIRFLGPKNRFLVELTRLSSFRRLVTRYYDAKFPGVMGEFILRTHCVNQALSRALRDRAVSQVVIFGAGFDARALCLPDAATATFFEIDHPATQARKRAVLGDAALRAGHVRYVALDLESESVTRILEHGYDPSQRSFFILEGLLYYLPEQAARSLLSFIAGNSARGSQVAFNYLDTSYLPGGERASQTGRILDHVLEIGEPFQFSLKPERLREFLAEVGLTLLEEMCVTEQAPRASPSAAQNYVLMDMFRTVLTEVAAVPSAPGESA
jgi:methyltransferase (TIGR00027 family)